jgi:hypothetical protein
MLFLNNSVAVVSCLNLLAGFFISNYCSLKDTSIGRNFESQKQVKKNQCPRPYFVIDVMR